VLENVVSPGHESPCVIDEFVLISG